MIRQQFHVENYWKIIVYYDVDYNFFDVIAGELLSAGLSRNGLSTLYWKMKSRRAFAVTFSNTVQHISILLFNRHRDKVSYLNSLVHEAEHVKQAMLEAYHVEDKGELPAYTIGYLVERMWEVFGKREGFTVSPLSSV